MPTYQVIFKSGDESLQNADDVEEVIESIEQEGWGGKEVIRKIFLINEDQLETTENGHRIIAIDLPLSRMSKSCKTQVWPEVKSKGEILKRKRYLRPQNPVRENQTKRFLRPEGDKNES